MNEFFVGSSELCTTVSRPNQRPYTRRPQLLRILLLLFSLWQHTFLNKYDVSFPRTLLVLSLHLVDLLLPLPNDLVLLSSDGIDPTLGKVLEFNVENVLCLPLHL